MVLGGYTSSSMAICAISALVLLWEDPGLQAELGSGQDCGVRWEHSNCNCQQVSHGGDSCPDRELWQGESPLSSLTCLVLGGRFPSYLGEHGRAGAHPCEEVGDLSAHGTAPPGPLAPASPVQQKRVRARPGRG